MKKTIQGRLRLALGASTIMLLALAGCASAPTAEAPSAPEEKPTESVEPAPDLLKGETIDMVVAYSPGGAYDRLARAIQPGFEEVSGSTIVVLNEPGAGSLLATNKTYATPPSEKRIQLVNTIGVVAAQIAEEVAEGVNYDLSKFEWIGSLSNEPELYVVPSGSDLSSVEGLKKAHKDQTPIRFGATGPGDNTWIAAFVMRDIFGFNIQIVSGFANVPEIYAAMARGEVDLAATSLASALVPINAGDAEAVFYVGDTMKGFGEVEDLIAGLTEISDLGAALGVDSQKVANFVEPYSSLTKVNRTIVAPPGTDPALVEAYRAAFDAVVSNQALVEEQAQGSLYIIPTDGATTAKIILEALNASPEFKELLVNSFKS